MPSTYHTALDLKELVPIQYWLLNVKLRDLKDNLPQKLPEVELVQNFVINKKYDYFNNPFLKLLKIDFLLVMSVFPPPEAAYKVGKRYGGFETRNLSLQGSDLECARIGINANGKTFVIATDVFADDPYLQEQASKAHSYYTAKVEALLAERIKMVYGFSSTSLSEIYEL